MANGRHQTFALIGATACTALLLGYKYGVSRPQARVERPIGPIYGDSRDFKDAVLELSDRLGEEESVSLDHEVRRAHSRTEWSTVESPLPVAVAYPKSTEQVVTIAKICSKYNVPMVSFSGGSSTEGHFCLPHSGLTIDFTHMHQIVEFHEDDMDVVVQPGLNWMSLNNQIRESGLFFPIDPSPTAKVGGMIATNCSGTHAVRYGTMKDWVINVTVVLANGNIIKTRRRPRKSSAGYNLTGLFAGSEGTLGIITECTLRLAVIPQQTSVAVAAFSTIHEAATAATRVLRAGILVSAMEIMDEAQMSIINRAGTTGRAWKEVPTIFFKFGGSPARVQEDGTTVEALSKTSNSTSFEIATSSEEADALWSARKQALWSILNLRREGDEFSGTDVAVPLSRLPDIIEASKEDMDKLGLFASILGHVGDGNFHQSVLYDGKSLEHEERVNDCVRIMIDRALEMAGTCSGEHGIGMKKKSSLEKELTQETIDVMRQIKYALDPKWLMNPGKVFDHPTMNY